MREVVLDAPTRSKLRDLAEVLEVRDESGRLLGHFLPAAGSDKAQPMGRECPYSDEEIEQLRQQTGGRSLGAIWNRLGRSE
ncbi:MAG: hypothetical protein MI757_19130 [Pirellulales bacterium]|nr:hypothetical protein [Pirellulales bacterium]